MSVETAKSRCTSVNESDAMHILWYNFIRAYIFKRQQTDLKLSLYLTVWRFALTLSNYSTRLLGKYQPQCYKDPNTDWPRDQRESHRSSLEKTPLTCIRLRMLNFRRVQLPSVRKFPSLGNRSVLPGSFVSISIPVPYSSLVSFQPSSFIPASDQFTYFSSVYVHQSRSVQNTLAQSSW